MEALTCFFERTKTIFHLSHPCKIFHFMQRSLVHSLNNDRAPGECHRRGVLRAQKNLDTIKLGRKLILF